MNEVTLALECESDVADSLSEALEAAAISPVVSAEKKYLDGSPASILQMVQVVASLMSAVAPIVAAHIANRKVKKIKLGTVEIENPTKEQWETLWRDYLSQQSSPKA